jgi:hypothetical protein
MGAALIGATPLHRQETHLHLQPVPVSSATVVKMTISYSDMEDVSLSSGLDYADDADEWLAVGYDVPHTPSTTSDEGNTRPSTAREASDPESDEDDDAHAHGELVPRRKPGGYDSRVEQMLYENPELPILIIEAGKSAENGGRYIVYTIKTGVCSTPGIRGHDGMCAPIADTTCCRSSSFADATPSLLRSETPSRDYTLRS